MLGIVGAGESLRQIRIAFPVGIQAAVGHSRIAVRFAAFIASETSMGKRVTIGVADWVGWSHRACEVALAPRIAPCAIWVPMPSLDRQLGILAIGYRLPSGGKDGLERGLAKILFDRRRRHAIDACAESLRRNERIRGVLWSRVDHNGLRV